MCASRLMHSAGNEVESKPITVLDARRIDLPRHRRVERVVRLLGGLRKAAAIAGVSTDTINNWRKPDARLPLDGLALLAAAANVTLDWLAGVDHPVDLELQRALSDTARKAS